MRNIDSRNKPVTHDQTHDARRVMAEGAGVAVGLAAVCLFLGARAFLRENA